MDKFTLLKVIFGHDSFREGQEPLADALLEGRDVLGVMPTGAGKSVCYQLPALLMRGVAVVVSPLISLMKDQVAALVHNGVPAAYINSSLTFGQQQEALQRLRVGAYKLVYVAPERLLEPGFLRLAQEAEISLVAVDEAHCVSQWGQDFRPSYLDIPTFIGKLPKRPVVGAFTATATAQVKKDIEKMLLLRDPLRVTTGFDRPNLFFEVVRTKQKDAWLQEFLGARPGQSGIVYCSTRKAVEEVCGKLCAYGAAATRYHAGLGEEERRRNQEDFEYDRARVMVATNAFGMGIDKSNVSFVVHYNMPKNLESYYQEAGRAGRDGSPAHCALLFSPQDVNTAKFLIRNSPDNEALSEEEQGRVRAQELRRLEQMTAYCKTAGCLRARLLEYFGQPAPAQCGNCGNCVGEIEYRDITVEAQKILSGVARAMHKNGYGVGAALIKRMLLGSGDKRLGQLGLDKLSTYGIMRGTPRELVQDYIDCLLAQGCLMQTEEKYPVLQLGGKAKKVLLHGEKVTYARRKPPAAEKPAPAATSPAGLGQDAQELFEALRALRAGLAAKENVPAYIVFSNATLADMAAKQPLTIEDFRQVSGIGQVKAEKYGAVFLERIREWRDGKSTE